MRKGSNPVLGVIKYSGKENSNKDTSL